MLILELTLKLECGCNLKVEKLCQRKSRVQDQVASSALHGHGHPSRALMRCGGGAGGGEKPSPRQCWKGILEPLKKDVERLYFIDLKDPWKRE